MEIYIHENYLYLKKIYKAAILFSFLLLQLSFTAFSQTPNQPVINSRLHGKIVDSKSKELLIGATVNIKGITNSTTTNAQGEFDLLTAQKYPYTIVVNYIGYKAREVVVDGSPVTVELDFDPKQLNDVVVIGYGTQKRVDITGYPWRFIFV